MEEELEESEGGVVPQDDDDDNLRVLGQRPSLAAEAVDAASAAAALEASDTEYDGAYEDDVEADGLEPETESQYADAGGGDFDSDADDDTDSEGGYSSDDYVNDTFAESFQEAAEHLNETHGGPIESLCVIPDFDGSEEEADENDGNDAASFRRFVAALAKPPGRGGRAVRAIHFDLVDWDRFREEDLARFFGEVLPSHPTLETIGLAGYEIPQQYVRMLVSSVRERSRTPLQKLQLECAIDHHSVQTIAELIRRNAALPELWVSPLRGPKLAPDDCKLICQSVLRNNHLEVLKLRVKEVLADTLDDVVADSSLRTLYVIADEFADGCAASVARQLRTNTTLESLRLINPNGDDDDGPSPFFRSIAEVLETYNLTLRKVTLRWGIPLKADHVMEARVLTLLRRRNRRIRRAIEQQLEPRGYHVGPASLWPRALGTVSAVPTLVHRLLRRGDLNALSDHLLRLDRAARGKKRGTPSACLT